MKWIPAAVLALSLQEGSLDPFYKFKVDTAWTYQRLENGAERKIIARVSGQEAGKVSLDWKEYEKDGSLRDSIVVSWSVVDGVLTAEARARNADGGEETLAFGMLKEGSKKGDRWTTAAGEVLHLGTAEVIVPAGTYKDAVRTQLKVGEEGKLDFYLVPKVGLVKIDLHEPGGNDNRFELAEFKEAK